MSDDCTHACCLVQEAGSSERAQRGPAPTRRALFAGHLQAAGDWPVTASRNLDAPEMGSPRSSDGGDTSSSGSSQVNWRGAAGKITQKRMQSMPACLLRLCSCAALRLLVASVSSSAASECARSWLPAICSPTGVAEKTLRGPCSREWCNITAKLYS